MKLTEQNLVDIENYIVSCGIQNSHIKNEMLDHLAILIEVEMGMGESFEIAFEKVLLNNYPNGIGELKNAMYELDTYPKFLTRRFIFISGLLLFCAQILGIIFKRMPDFYKIKLFVISNHLTSFIYLPLFLVFLLYRVKNKSFVIFSFILVQTLNYSLFTFVQMTGSRFYYLPISGCLLIIYSIYLIINLKNKTL